jgi:glycosyltransferase involved in cell wall biosynthesis
MICLPPAPSRISFLNFTPLALSFETTLLGGSGRLHSALEHAIAAEGLADRVEVLGFIPEEQLPTYYQAADAFLLPTRDLECFGLPVVEAMACGCASLVMPDGGPAEICADHPEYVAAANSADALAERVASFVSGEIPARREQFAQEARRLYSESAIAGAVLDLVENLTRAR